MTAEFRSIEFEWDEVEGLFDETEVSVSNRIMQELGFDAAEVTLVELERRCLFDLGGRRYRVCTGARFYANRRFWDTDFDTAGRVRSLDGALGGEGR